MCFATVCQNSYVTLCFKQCNLFLCHYNSQIVFFYVSKCLIYMFRNYLGTKVILPMIWNLDNFGHIYWYSRFKLKEIEWEGKNRRLKFILNEPWAMPEDLPIIYSKIFSVIGSNVFLSCLSNFGLQFCHLQRKESWIG